jgi:hypothetical protein
MQDRRSPPTRSGFHTACRRFSAGANRGEHGPRLRVEASDGFTEALLKLPPSILPVRKNGQVVLLFHLNELANALVLELPHLANSRLAARIAGVGVTQPIGFAKAAGVINPQQI